MLVLSCPFCGRDIARHENRANPYAKCETVGCKGAQLPVLRIDDPRDVAAWNTRALRAEVIAEIRPLVADLRTHAEISGKTLTGEPWLAAARDDAKAIKRLRELVREGT